MKQLYIFFPALFFSLFIFSQTQVSISSDSSWATIGERIRIKIIVKTNLKSDNIIAQTGGKKEFEIIHEYELKKSLVDGSTLYEKNIEIAFFKTGDYNIGPVKVKIEMEGETLEERESNTIPIKIKSVLKENDKDINPLKDLVEIKGNPLYVLKYFIIFLFFTAVILFIIYRIKKKKEQPEIPLIPILPPIEEFEKRINSLKGKNFIEDKKIKIFFIALTEIYKTFLTRFYDINAEDLTSYEIIRILKKREEDQSIPENFNLIFTTSDLSKFARFIPGQKDIDDLYIRIFHIIDELKKRTIKEEKDVALRT
ncbi:MAG: hypothetical protein ABFR75_00815 [Acidobacteriota bacterium]